MEHSEGLLDKAKKLRESYDREATEVEIQERQASNPQEHDDILAHIEKIASQNRIQVTPSLFHLSPRQSGKLLPVVVNIATFGILALVLGGLWFFFNSQQSSVLAEEVSLQSAEGKLLAEIKKQSEAELAAKDKQLKEIEDQLGRVQNERNNLATTMEDKVRQRELSIRAQMESLLEAERQKLRAQGYSEAEINRRIKEFEQQKTLEFNAQIAAYRKQLETEKAQAEAELTRLEQQFSSQITRVNQDREKLLNDSKAREQELRNQLAAAQLATSTAGSDAQDKARQAQSQLDRIKQVQDQEKAIDEQIGGFYGTLRSQIEAKRWADADTTLTSLATYLRSSVMSSSDTLIKKRDKELYSVEILNAYVQSERSAPDTSQLVKNASVITEAEALRTMALAQVKAGNRGAAAQTWNQLLQSIPGGTEAVSFIREDTATAQKAELDKAASDYQSQLAALRAELEGQTSAGAQARINVLLGQIDTTTKELEATKTTAAEVQKRLQDEVTRLTRTTTGLTTTTEELRATVRQRDQDILTLRNELAQLKAAPPASSPAGNEETTRQIAALNAQIISLQAESDRLKSSNEELQTRPADNSSELARIGELEGQLSASRSVEADYKSLLGAFQTYQTRLRAITTTNPDQRVQESKRALDAFLTSDEARKAMPGLSTAIGSYEAALVDSGKPAAYLEATESILSELLTIKDKAERETWLRNRINRENNQARKEFLENLIPLVR